MSTTTYTPAVPARGALAPAGLAVRLARAGLVRALKSLRGGAVLFRDAVGGDELVGDINGPICTVRVVDPAFWTSIALGGGNGAARAYMEGHWRADNLVQLLRLMARNRQLIQRLAGATGLSGRLLDRWFHARRDNTRRGSRRNIAAHYDLGNEFYRLWLDETMTYSSAWFVRPGMTLAEAQTAKYDRICEQLQLGPDDHVLEIGTGWGGFALHAAMARGCRVTTTTISAEQHRMASKRVADAGLAHRVDVRLDDYRDLTAPGLGFSAIVSIEMIEAVGHRHHRQFIDACDRLLARNGRMALQMISMPDAEYPRYLRSPDFIQRYVFPGSCCPSLARIGGLFSLRTDMELVDAHDLTADYAETLRRWHAAFRSCIDGVRALGFDERFVRLWEYYLAYCEAGFAERSIVARQVVWARPAWRPVSPAGAPGGVT